MSTQTLRLRLHYFQPLEDIL
ncbi:hypothetical protein FQN60_016758, partial [Etheostoma spectabile]